MRQPKKIFIRKKSIGKSVFCIFFILACGIINAQQGKDLAGYWKFDELKGKLAIDQVTGNVDSIHYIFNDTKYPSDPIRRNGIYNSALDFDGFSNWIARPADKFATPTKAITISVWVAPRAFEHGDSNRLSAIVNQQNIAEKTGFALGMFRHGRWSFQVGNGDQWIEVWDENHLIPRRQWSYLVATYDASTATATLYLNGKEISHKTLSQNLPIKPADEPLIIGKHNQPVKLNARSNIELNMYNGLLDELKIYDRTLTKDEIGASYRSYIAMHKNTVPAISYAEIKLDRAPYKDDPNRPQYHAIPPGHWMNEPHAPFYYNGKYHLTYQHNPTGPYWHQIHWGHWASDDLVHWYDVPEAIFPGNDSVSPDGIWSGSATFDDKGVPVYFYTFGNWSKVKNQGVALAFPKDPKDPNLSEWVKDSKPLIVQGDDQGLIGEFRDPFAWKDKEDNKWYLLVGSGIQNKGGTAWFYESDDFKKWKLRGPFYLSNYEKYPFLGSIWELPVFLPIGKYENGETKYVMIVSPKGLKQNVEVYYWLGRFDKKNGKFIPDDEEPQYWDYGIRTFIGPSGMVDPKTGRVLIFTITAGGNGPGWSGNASFPTHIFLNKEGKLGVKPIEELQSLRKKELISLSNMTLPEANEALKNVQGDMLEIILEMESSADKYGIKIRKSPDDKEETILLYDAVNKKLRADLSKTSLRASGFRGPRDPLSGTDKRADLIQHFDLKGESLKLHIFIDKALVQAYANDLKTITTWTYPSLETSKGLQIWAENGNAKVKSIQVWEMKSIYY
ncbi:MAG TPA: GH32 C-terminal domain-containing protein [Flavisolibacter sp.]|jgi:sucrose-6-phosphate hydrolase SacC (GH32 family)|nr:GH32 C-terminal domain-containing protein [Flavisolibacter sp.]